MNKLAWWLLLILIFIFLGYFREFLFVHLNVILYEKYYQMTTEAPFPSSLNFLRNYSYESLYYSKYFLTGLFVLLFLAANYFALLKLTEKKYLIKILSYTYAIMLFLGLCSMAYSHFIQVQVQEESYTLSRWLMGIAQSPIICLILIASEKLYTKTFPS